MGRRCTICTHSQRDEIDAALAAGEAFRNVSIRFRDVKVAALYRHKTGHMGKALAKATRHVEAVVRRGAERAAREQSERGFDFFRTASKFAERAEKILDACDRWLTDPRCPDEYTLDPRGLELDVLYSEIVGVGPKGGVLREQKVATLQELLEIAFATKLKDVNGNDTDIPLREPLAIRTKHADPRTLVLNAARVLQAQIPTLRAIAAEQPKGDDEDALASTPAWRALRDGIVKALRKQPAALRAVLAVLGRADVPGK